MHLNFYLIHNRHIGSGLIERDQPFIAETDALSDYFNAALIAEIDWVVRRRRFLFINDSELFVKSSHELRAEVSFGLLDLWRSVQG